MSKIKPRIKEIFTVEDSMRKSGIRVISTQRKESSWGKFKGFVNTTNARIGSINNRLEGFERSEKRLKKKDPFKMFV